MKRHVVGVLCALACAALFAEETRPESRFAAPINSKWTESVTPENAWREYPRPQMVREGWTCLNGLWDYAITPAGADRPAQADGRILVPFPVESRLSGVGREAKPQDLVWYRRGFEAKPAAGMRTLLNFEGVDFRAQVFVNGREATDVPHEGGGAPFAVDVTDFLSADGSNALEVVAWDPTDDGIGMTGKQSLRPSNCFFRAASGIWKSVWLETVPETYVSDYRAVPDLDAGCVRVTPRLRGNLSAARCTVKAFDGGREIASGELARTGGTVTLGLPRPVRTWSPDDPHLYDLEISVTADGRTDTVRGFFGMRKIEVVKDAAGVPRIALNGRITYLLGTLDQGWWPDGYVTPPSEAAMLGDVDYLRRAGFNCVRKHIKTEPRSFYAHCDRIGLMVLQDMPSFGTIKEQAGIDCNARYAMYRRELRDMVDALANHPSIVMWIPYNEGWGQHSREQTRRTVEWLKRTDPTRLVDPASGWNDWEGGTVMDWRTRKASRTEHLKPGEREVGDIIDRHRYPGPAMFPANPNRASFLGEFGAVDCVLRGHFWDPRGGEHKNAKSLEKLDRAALVREYERRFVGPLLELKRKGLCGSIYCETTDVFWEACGLLTFDRAVEKLPAELLAPLNARLTAETGKLPVSVLPELAFFSICDKDVESGDVSELKAIVEALAGRGTFNYVNVTCRCHHDDTEPAVKRIVGRLAEIVHACGLKMSYDLDPRHSRNEFLRQHPDSAQQLAVVALGDAPVVEVPCPGRLRDHMSSNGEYAPVGCRMGAAYAVKMDGAGAVVARRTVTDKARFSYDGARRTAAFSCEGLAPDERLAALAVFTLHSCDVFSPHLIPFMDALIAEYAELGIDGAMRDEYGFPPSFDKAFAEHRAYWFSAPLAEAYRAKTGRDFLPDILTMAFPCADPARSACVDAYMRLLYERNTEIECRFYDLHKRLFGRDSMVCKHPTWICFIGWQELNHNGLDWWSAKRDWAQVDEVTYPCAALGMAKKWGGANWLCEGYQQTAEKYAPLVWRYALAGGRMAYHPVGYPPPKRYTDMPGATGRIRRLTDILDAGALRAQECVRLLNRISSAQPVSPVAVVFGHSRMANWTDSAYLKWGYELTRDLWSAGWLPDLYPSTEFDAGTFAVDRDGFLCVGAQRYDAVALVNLSDADRAAFGKIAGSRPLKTAVFRDPDDASAVAAALEKARAVKQPPLAPGKGGLHLPRPDGTLALLDGTVVRIKANEVTSAPEPIEGELFVGGRRVRYSASGLFAARMGADGNLAAVAGAGLLSVEGPGFSRTFSRPTDFAWVR